MRIRSGMAIANPLLSLLILIAGNMGVIYGASLLRAQAKKIWLHQNTLIAPNRN